MLRVRASLRPILKLVVDNILLASRPEKSGGFSTLHKMVENENKLPPSLIFFYSQCHFRGIYFHLYHYEL